VCGARLVAEQSYGNTRAFMGKYTAACPKVQRTTARAMCWWVPSKSRTT
jgi:hypothetical protein